MVRNTASFMPPAAGTRPTPVSTRPMATSASAWTRWQCRQTSRPPPSTRPNGAATMGMGAYLMAMLTRWAVRSRWSMPSQSSASDLVDHHLDVGAGREVRALVADDQGVVGIARLLRWPSR